MDTLPTLDTAVAYIKALDFSDIIRKIVRDQGWKPHQALQLSEYYRNYLFLIRKYPKEQLPPSEEIDLFWHQHILDTRRYHADCQAIFGAYHHHYPYFGMDGKTDQQDLNRAFENTQARYNQEFGEPIYNVRIHFKQMIKSWWASMFHTDKAAQEYS